MSYHNIDLVEKHVIKKSHKLYKSCDELSWDSKNLYNSVLYSIRQHYFETKKYKNYNETYLEFRHTEHYLKLTDKIAKQTLRMVDKSFKSFFKALRSFKKTPSKFKGKPFIPNYKDSLDGRYIVRYDKESISKPNLDKGYVKLSNSNIKIPTKKANRKNIRCVRIIPRNNHYIIEVVYRKIITKAYEKKHNCGIDIGVNNLLSCVFSNNKKPLIFNGKPIKSINQYYNKKKTKIQSELKIKNGKYTSNKLVQLTNKRNRKIEDYLHHVSTKLVNQLVSNSISDVYIGYNKGWKQDIKIGKRNNQNFVSIPFYKLISMLEYKLKMEGIILHKTNEAYTSKCSFIDDESIKKHKVYKGKRKKRGLFKSFQDLNINADINAAFNILRKAVPDVRWDRGCAVHPKVINV